MNQIRIRLLIELIPSPFDQLKTCGLCEIANLQIVKLTVDDREISSCDEESAIDDGDC